MRIWYEKIDMNIDMKNWYENLIWNTHYIQIIQTDMIYLKQLVEIIMIFLPMKIFSKVQFYGEGINYVMSKPWGRLHKQFVAFSDFVDFNEYVWIWS